MYKVLVHKAVLTDVKGSILIDEYCERTAVGLLNEPVNALTNLCFVVAAVLFWRHAYTLSRGSIGVGNSLLVLLMVLIGLGSTLFHTFANPLSEWLDILPILGMQLVWLWLYLKRIMKVGAVGRLISTLGYLFLSFTLSMLPDPTPGSMGYFGPLAIITVLGIYHKSHVEKEPQLLFMMAGVFFVSLLFRSIDQAVCNTIPIGTHFIWHILNAVVLYGVCRCVVLDKRVGQA